MAIFDQRGQKVGPHQINVAGDLNIAGDINFGAVQDKREVVAELVKLQAELDRAIKAGLFDEETATDAEYQLKKAVQQAQKPEPDKKSIMDHLKRAKDLVVDVATTVGAVTGLAAALKEAVEAVPRVFP
jgi:hypothetical protein